MPAEDTNSARAATPRYGAVAIALHWLLALMIFGSLGVGLTMSDLPVSPWRLKLYNWHFNAQRFPQAWFQSTSINGSGGGRFEVAGKLTIKGNVRDIVVPVNVVQNAGTSVASGAFTIKHLDFKIGEGDWGDTSIVANDVQVRFKLALTGLCPL